MKVFLKLIDLFRSPKEAVIGVGLSHVFLLFFSQNGETTTIDKEMVRFFKAVDNMSFKIKTTWLRLMMHHKLCINGKWYGQAFSPYKRFNASDSGWNEKWFDKMEEFVRKADKLRITTGLSLIDGNNADLGPYPLGDYIKEVTVEQEAYFRKVLGRLGSWKDAEYFPKYRFVLEPTNEHFGHTQYPTTLWMGNAVKLLKELTSNKIQVGAWHKRFPSNADFHVIHSGIGAAGIGWVCNEEQTASGEWGGGDTELAYRTLLQKHCPNGVVMIFANWNEALLPVPFAQNQIKALEWGHNQGWY